VEAGREGGTAAPTEVRSEALSNRVLLALIWLLGASGCLLLFWGSKLTFLLDDWEFLLYRRGFNADAILLPHGEHISVAPVLVYKALLATVGMGSALPFRGVSTALFLLSAVLLFVFLARRVGQWPALAATAVVLFLGAAWEDLLWAFQVGYFGSMAAGLGMLLALERGDRRGDRLACLLLTVSILFSSLGLPFAAGAAVQVLLRPDRWRRLYVFAVPLAVYAAWWLGWGHTAENSLSLHNVLHAPIFALDGVAAAVAAALGLATPSIAGTAGGLDWGRPLAGIAILVGLWWLYRLGRVPKSLWVVVAIAAAFWILGGFNQMPGREPISSRYQYIGVIFVFLIAAELLRGVQIGPAATIAIFAVAAASIASNIYFLHQAYDENYRPASQLEKAALGAVEIARDTVEPAFVLSEEVAVTGYVHVEAAPYLSARDAFGSPAYTAAEIATAEPLPRFAADKVLFGALRIGLVPAPPSALPGAAPLAAQPDASGLVTIPAGGCVAVPSDGANSPLLGLPRDGIVLRAGRDPIGAVKLTRFATGEFPVVMAEAIPAGGTAELPIPPDRSTVPWKVQLETASATTVCGREGGGEA
jgi:hypothetical protein